MTITQITEKFWPDAEPGGGEFGRFEAGLLVTVAVGLTVMHFVGSESTFLALFGDWVAESARSQSDLPVDLRDVVTARQHPFYDLFCLLHWVICCGIGFVAIPVAYLLWSGRSVSEMYLGWGNLGQHLPLYGLLFLIVIVPVVVVSYSEEYQAIYPFYRDADRSIADLVIWELAYGFQFFALEFLFRGVMLAGLRKWLGSGAVFVMLVPYCMLHFMKTASESLGAIIAGVVLGGLAMKNKSIWGGVLLHWLVAISMDVLSLMQQGRMPTQLWP